MNDEKQLWNIFANSGRIDDYLNYRQSVGEAEANNVNEHTGHRDPGADASGKRQDDLDLN